MALWLGFWSHRDTQPGLWRQSLEVSEATALCPCTPGILTHYGVHEALLGLGTCHPDRLVPPRGCGVSLREDAESLGTAL